MGDLFQPYHLLFIGLLVFFFVVTFKIYARDARLRGKSPVLVCLVILFSFPWGLIAWLVFRPEPIDRTGETQEFCLNNPPAR